MKNKAIITKEFRWEMGHRLPFHNGLCKNLHGHSYRMIVSLEGELDLNGFLLDYFELKQIVQPLVDTLDHAFMCSSDDATVLHFLEEHDMKKLIVDFNTTAENISLWFAESIKDEIKSYKNIDAIDVTIFETPTASATRRIEL